MAPFFLNFLFPKCVLKTVLQCGAEIRAPLRIIDISCNSEQVALLRTNTSRGEASFLSNPPKPLLRDWPAWNNLL